MRTLEQPAPSVPAADRKPARPALSRLGVVFTFVFVFSCFFPNPALPVGSSTGLQLSQALALLFLPVMLVIGLPKRHTLALLLVTLSLAASGFYVVLTGRAITDGVVVKVTAATVLALLPLLPVGWLLYKGYALHVLRAVAWGIIANSLWGAYQLYSFSRNTFPMIWIYQNPSYGDFIQSLEVEWALYVKRAFGFFPEPSAMSASIGPWLVLMVGLLMYPGLLDGITAKTKALLWAALILGLALIMTSQSGFMLPLMASLLVVALPMLFRLLIRAYRPGNMLLLVILGVSGVVLAIIAVSYLGDRLDFQNDSWQQRGQSILWGIFYLGTDPGVFLFGVGPGQSYEMLSQAGGEETLSSGSAVWSVTVNHLQEQGLVGGLALLAVFGVMLNAIIRSGSRMVGLACLMAWSAGVILTTSYISLSPIWLFMGALLLWDHLFAPSSAKKDEDPHRNVEIRRKAGV